MAVTPSLPVKTVREFIAYAKANPGKINMASGDCGKRASYVRRIVQADGWSRPGSCAVPVELLPRPVLRARTGRLHRGRRIAGSGKGRQDPRTCASRRRSVRTFCPTCPPSTNSCRAIRQARGRIGAPKNTPAAVIATLNSEINAIVSNADAKSRLAALGIEPQSMTPAEFGKFCADETAKWAKVVTSAGIKAD